MQDVLDVMYSRRTIRDFTDEEVDPEKVKALLKAAMAAPSAQDLRPWHFCVVHKRKMLEEMAKVHKYAYMLARAPLGIVVCGDTQVSQHWVEDTCAATQNLLLAATALGLGGVWISLYPKKAHQKSVRDLLHIPDHIGVLCVVAVGHPAEKKKIKTEFDENRVHQERW